MTYTGFGNGSAGPVTLSSHAPIDSATGGTSGAKPLTATNASFASGQLIKIRQERGGSYGSWEINIINTYVAGTITCLFNLVNTYSSAGNDRAQVMVIPEYSSVRISSSFNIKAWNDVVGGHWSYMCSGETLIDAGVTISGRGYGFRGGDREVAGAPPLDGEQGDSPTGAPTRATNNNGLGGGAAGDRNAGEGDNAGGAGHASAGNAGDGVAGGDITGDGGAAIDTLNLETRQCMGAGGGGGVGPGGNDRGGFGGAGGATFDIYSYQFTNHGILDFRGNTGNTNSEYGSYTDVGIPTPGGSQGGGGGAGAGGSGRINAVIFNNDGTISLAGQIGGLNNNSGKGRGGTSSQGILNIKSCDYTNTGTLTAAVTINTGGHDYCQVPGSIF